MPKFKLWPELFRLQVPRSPVKSTEVCIAHMSGDDATVNSLVEVTAHLVQDIAHTVHEF